MNSFIWLRRIRLLALTAALMATPLTVGAPVAMAGDLNPDMEKEFGKNAGVTVKGMRFGRHPDKLRLVLDATGPVNFDYWISASGKTIVVLIPQVKWTAADYVRMDQGSPIYRIAFFPNPTGGGVLSILGQSALGLSAIEQLGPDRNRPHRVVFDIPNRQQDAWLPAAGIMRNGKLLPAHENWPPVQQVARDRPLPVITRRSVAQNTSEPQSPGPEERALSGAEFRRVDRTNGARR